MVCKLCGSVFIGHRTAQFCSSCKKKKLNAAKRASAARNLEGRKEFERKRTSEFLILVDKAKSSPCTICLVAYPEECMDLDHLDPEEKNGRRGSSGRSNRRLSIGGAEAAESLLKITRVICAVCHRLETEKADHYQVNSPIPDKGKVGLNNLSTYKRMRVRKLEAAALITSLKSGPCVDCGKSYPPRAMDFDHLSDKRFQVANMVRAKSTKGVILREVAKCELVCANCHRIRTAKRKVTQ